MTDRLIRPIAAAFLAACALLQGCANPASSTDNSATPRPSLHDDYLDNLVGDWRLTRVMPTRTAENTMQCRWVLGHQFVQMHMIDVKSPPAYEAIVLVGYDRPRSRYIAHWCDSFGGEYSADGYGVRKGDSIEFRFDYPDGPFFNTFTWHPETRTWTFRGENGQPDGSRKLFMEDTAKKQ